VSRLPLYAATAVVTALLVINVGAHNPSFVAMGLGVIEGVLLWTILVRPGQLNEHERRRRRCGLPPKRHLPEDD